MELTNIPFPVPSLVCAFNWKISLSAVVNTELRIVGFSLVSQQTPLAVIGEPPSPVMSPPLIADVEVIDDT